jgi:peptidyl-prolyl cis-trans isomerase A (cyclophilin A)
MVIARRAVLVLALCLPCPGRAEGRPPTVLLSTSRGDITVELDAERAPLTVRNFLEYVREGYYDGTLLHRVVRNFIIQGGGLAPSMREKPGRRAPIPSEAGNGVTNAAGTLAMARTSAADSATAEFFINLRDNPFLDRASALDHIGYAVFGRVTQGMDVLKRIAQVKTTVRGPHPNVPVEPIVIRSARIVAEVSDRSAPPPAPPPADAGTGD